MIHRSRVGILYVSQGYHKLSISYVVYYPVGVKLLHEVDVWMVD